jgi:hypothetical protein
MLGLPRGVLLPGSSALLLPAPGALSCIIDKRGGGAPTPLPPLPPLPPVAIGLLLPSPGGLSFTTADSGGEELTAMISGAPVFVASSKGLTFPPPEDPTPSAAAKLEGALFGALSDI